MNKKSKSKKDPENETEKQLENVRTRAKVPIVYSRKYAVRFAGLEKLHPFDAAKGKHIQQLLCDELKLDSGDFYDPNEITREELLRVHTPFYLSTLKTSTNVACIAEVPVLFFMPICAIEKGYLRPMRFQTAGSILAGKLALEYGWSINLGGGFHHCCSYKGGGFCPYADITLLIERLFHMEQSRVRTAMIVDLDAHQGNGHARDFINTRSVYILDMYNAHIYPEDEDAKPRINCAVELNHQTPDDYYLKQLNRCLLQAVTEFTPDVVIYNAGTDILKGDALGNLAITPEGVIERDRLVFSTFRSLNIPIVMLLSGGYVKSSKRVISDSIINLRRQGWLGLK